MMAKGNLVKSQRRWFVLSLAAGAAAGLGAGFLFKAGQDSIPPGLMFAALLVIGGLAFVPAIPWWKRLDDMQKHSQYESWYWGGSAGMVLGIMGLIAFAGMPSDTVGGALLMVIAQVAGYILYSIWFRIRHGGGGL